MHILAVTLQNSTLRKELRHSRAADTDIPLSAGILVRKRSANPSCGRTPPPPPSSGPSPALPCSSSLPYFNPLLILLPAPPSSRAPSACKSAARIPVSRSRLSGIILRAAANYLSRYDFLSIAMSSVLPENLLPASTPVSSPGYRSSGSVKLHGKNGNKPATSPKRATLITKTKPLKISDFVLAYYNYLLAWFYPPKLSYMMLSGSTPRLSSMPTTAFDMGPGPHM